MKPEPKRDGLIILLLTAIALLVRLYFSRYTQAILDADGIAQAAGASDIFFGKRTVFDTSFPNLYLVCILPLLKLAGSAAPEALEWAGRCVSIFFGALTVAPVYLFARTFAGRRTAAAAGLLVAMHPDLVDFSLRVKTDSIFIFFVALTAWLLWAALRRRSLPLYFVAGLSLGLTYYSRVEGFTYFLLSLLIIAAGETRSARGFFARAVPAALLIVIGFSIFLVPYQRYLVRQGVGVSVSDTGGLILFKSQKMFEEEVFGGAAYREQDSVGARERGVYSIEFYDDWTLAKCLRRREFYAKMGYQLFKNAFYLAAIFGPLLPFLLLGAAFIYFKRRERGAVLFAFSFLGLIYAVTMIMLSRKQYLLQPLPLLLVFAAAGFVAAADFVFVRSRDSGMAGTRRAIAAALVFAAVTGGMAPWTSKHMKKLAGQHPVELKRAGAWAAENLPRDVKVMDYYGVAVFYAGLGMENYVNTPFDNFENCLKRAKEAGADYWVVSERYTATIVPQLAWVLAAAPADLPLKVVHREDTPERVVILKLK